MPTQTGSIDLKSTNAVRLYAAAGFSNVEENYSTKGELAVTNEAVALNASKLVTVANPNLSPFFEQAKSDVYDASTNPNGYWKRITASSAFTTYDMECVHNGSGGWAHFAGTSTTSNPYVRFEPVYMALKPSTKYTFLVEVDGTFSNTGAANLALASGISQSDAKDPFANVYTVDVKSGGTFRYSAITRSDLSASTVLFRGYLQMYGAGAFDCYIRISLYEEAYDSETQTWTQYSGPWKPYSGNQLYASQSELKVQSDKISMVVADNSTSSSVVIQPNAINAISQNVTIKSPDGTSTVIEGGKIKANSLTIGALSDLSVGGRNLLRKEDIYCYTASQEPNLDKSAYVASGKVTYSRGAVQNEGFYITNNERTAPSAEHVISFDAKCTSGSISQVYLYSSNPDNTAAFKVYANGAYLGGKNANLSLSLSSSAYTHFEIRYTSSSTVSTSGTYHGIIIQWNKNVATAFTVEMANLKWEKGTMATDWSPAPEDVSAYADALVGGIEVGGQNLLLGTSSEWSEWVTPTANTNNLTKYWYISKNDELCDWAKAGQNLTFTMEIEFSGVTASSSGTFAIYSQDCWKSASGAANGSASNADWNTGAAARAMNLTTAPSNGVYTYTKTVSLAAAHTSRYALQFSTRADYWASGKYRVRKVKYELGNKPTAWSPAPEDVDAGIADAAKTATNYITADSSGIKLHDAGDTSNYQHLTSSGTEIYVGGDSVAKFGSAGAQIGKLSSAHSIIDANGQRFYAIDGTTQLANIGYGEGNEQSGTAEAPYYTLGYRLSSASILPVNYDSTLTYEVGDMCVYNSQEYVCKEAITTPEAWNSSRWMLPIGSHSVAESISTVASGFASHAEGVSTAAVGSYSHAEGRKTVSSGAHGHSEGYSCKANGSQSHAEGYSSFANGNSSHAECAYARANGDYSHAEGYSSYANGDYSHAQNNRTIASSESQTALGKFNVEDANDTYALIVGNGTSNNARSNALAVKWDGTVDFFDTADPSFVFKNTNTSASGVTNWRITMTGYGNLRLDSSSNGGGTWTNGVKYFASEDRTWPIANGGTGQTGSTSTTTVSDIATAASGFTITGASYAQWGKVATVEISLRNANAISSGNITNTTLVTMVSGKRPKVAAPFTTGGTGPVVTGYINTNGNVILSATAASIAAATSGTTLSICATYVVA